MDDSGVTIEVKVSQDDGDSVTETGAAQKFNGWLDDANVAAVVMPKDRIFWAVDKRGVTIDSYELAKGEPPFDLEPIVAAHPRSTVSVGRSWQGLRISIQRPGEG